MSDKRNEVLEVLNDLLRMEDVLACMLAKKGLDGIVPKTMKVKNVNLWSLISRTTSTIFDLIDKFYDYGLDRLYFELGEYTVVIATIDRTFSLVVVIPSLANMGLLDVEIENSKRKIKDIIKRKEPAKPAPSA